jgi:cytochrome c peroxidase
MKMRGKRSLWFAIALIVLIAAVLGTTTGMALAKKHPALKPPAHVLTQKEQLGKKLFFDANLSEPRGLACAGCHSSGTGFTGPDATTNINGAVYQGAVGGRFGNRKPPSAAYGGASPVFSETGGAFAGGMFWDGRATGLTLGDPLAEQAKGPFLNPLEQNNPSAAAVVNKVAHSSYAGLFKKVWGSHAFDDPIAAYDNIARSIAAYEKSHEVSAFSSRYDTYLKTGKGLTNEEKSGLTLFQGNAKCSKCHVSTPGSGGTPPMFTDYSYDNLGIPKNPMNPFYGETTFNPAGPAWVDLGLGGFLANTSTWASLAPANDGKFKVPTLRNVDKRPYAGFVKAYGHNGYFKSLDSIVHFYNTRDAMPWPAPETTANLNTTELGNLGLTSAEEHAIVAFLKTLSDR